MALINFCDRKIQTQSISSPSKLLAFGVTGDKHLEGENSGESENASIAFMTKFKGTCVIGIISSS